MPDGGPSELERARQEELYQSVAGAARPPETEAMFEVGGEEEETEEPEEDGLDPVEILRQNQAAAAFAGAGGQQQGGGLTDALAQADAGIDQAKEKIQGQIDRVNHYLLVEILPEVVAFDFACFGLLSCITLPLVYWPTAALWGLEVYNDFTGNSTPLTPRLSWKSFAPPGTEIDIPLPNQPLWIAWFAYVALLVFLSAIWLLILALFIYAWNDPAAALSGLKSFFPFMPSMLGI